MLRKRTNVHFSSHPLGSHRFNNFTLSVLNAESDDEHQETKKVLSRGGQKPKKTQDKENVDEQNVTMKTKKTTRKTKKKLNV